MRDWATSRRRRWSASRIAAAIALHALVLASLKLAIDRVEMPRNIERATTLVTVVLHAAPPPALHALPLPRPAHALPPASRVPASRVPEVRAHESEPRPIAPPAPPAPDAPDTPAVAAVAAPASSAPPDLRFLDDAATRQAIRSAARGRTLASLGNAITSSEPTSSERLARNLEAAHKADCMKDLAGLGLLAAPVLLAAEAMGKCAHKL